MNSKIAGITTVVLCATGLAASHAHGGAVFHSPTAYKSFTNSPWAIESADVTVEDFEDGLLNAPGLSASAGAVRVPGQYTDSVDFDDGLIDGWGQGGHSWLTTNGAAGITFSFDDGVLGSYPTLAGLVWTDGNWASTLTFEAFDAQGQSLGTMQHVLGDNNDGTGQTDEDRFLGVEHAGGISAIRIWTEFGGIEVDHVQYGQQIPGPAALAVLGAAGLLGGRRRRHG